MRTEGYDAKVTALLRRNGFFKDRDSYLGHTVEDNEPHLHLEGKDRSALREWLFAHRNTCQIKLPGCTRIATEMDHDGEAAEGTRFDERGHVRRACHSCHVNRHGRTTRFYEVKHAEAVKDCERLYPEEQAHGDGNG